MDNFFARVYEMVRQIPGGRVATYGQIARLIGEPRKARYVGFALHTNPHPWPGDGDAPDDGSPAWPGDTGEPVPCQRVVFADGRLCEGFAFGGPEVQRGLLEAEGVRFLANGKVDLRKSRWEAGL